MTDSPTVWTYDSSLQHFRRTDGYVMTLERFERFQDQAADREIMSAIVDDGWQPDPWRSPDPIEVTPHESQVTELADEHIWQHHRDGQVCDCGIRFEPLQAVAS